MSAVKVLFSNDPGVFKECQNTCTRSKQDNKIKIYLQKKTVYSCSNILIDP